MGRFNGFLKSTILRVSEARDLGETNRFSFYDHMKAYTAAPPDVLRVDEKNLREHAILNVTGVIITSNHKADGIYLPADDRRHYVAWSDLSKEDFNEGYWSALWNWYDREGCGHVAAFSWESRHFRIRCKGTAAKNPSLLGYCRCQPRAGRRRVVRRHRRPRQAGRVHLRHIEVQSIRNSYLRLA
jgi:hypothetical protein